jgi:putative iron-dependent peroxidase
MAGQDVEWDEVQGIVLSAYWAKPYTRYFLLTIRDGREQAARAWLGQLEQKKWLSLNDDRTRSGPSLNIAFSFSGLEKLGLKKEELDTFPWDFRDGMTSALRSNLLADRGYNDPAEWEWGGNGAEPHLLVMLYANEKEIATLARDVERSWRNA